MEESQFDVVILGTGLVESITAAALSKAGFKVAHIDSNPYYGSDDASLSLDELVQWVDNASKSNDPNARFQRISRSQEVPSQTRQYSICLRPAIIPATGPLISSLIMSGVAKYSGFRLLECVSVYDSSGKVRNVPGSKEDIFKNKDISLIEKRKLMRFLTFAAAGDFIGKKELEGKENITFLDFLQSTFSLSKEIATVIAYSLAFCMSSEEPTLPTLQRLRTYLRSSGRYGSSPFLIGHYGGMGDIAQGFCRASAVSGGVYILAHKVSSIKPIPPLGSSEDEGSESHGRKHHFNYAIDLEDFPETLSSNLIISSPPYVPENLKDDVRVLPSSSINDFKRNVVAIARCISIIDQALGLKSSEAETDVGNVTEQDTVEINNSRASVDTAMLVYPPSSVLGGSTTHSATVLINGEGNMSAPKGKWIVYISLPLSSSPDDSISPEDLLKPYLDALMSLPADVTKTPIRPLFSAFYLEVSSPESTSGIDKQSDNSYIVAPPLPFSPLPDMPDKATIISELLFKEAIKILHKSHDHSIEETTPFWPPLPVEEEDDDEW